MGMLAEPRALAELTEIDPHLPPGSDDRFSGYGVMGLPFASGHVLALRRFPASSLGYGYSSVWHRAPDGRWTFWSDVPPAESCARFFGEAIAEVAVEPITVHWTGPRSLHITVGSRILDWKLGLRSTPLTMAMNATGRLLTDGMWQNRRVLQTMGAVVGRVLGVGRVRLTGTVPNGQRYMTNPLKVWRVADVTATLHDRVLGSPGALEPQAELGDFAIPQRGIFVLGRAFFEPFDPACHSSAIVAGGGRRMEGVA
jgi:hypothetical protein